MNTQETLAFFKKAGEEYKKRQQEIQSMYSSIDIYEEVEKRANELIFLDFLYMSWSVSEVKCIGSFLPSLQNLDWHIRDKFVCFYHLQYNHLPSYAVSTIGDENKTNCIFTFFELDMFSKTSEEDLKNTIITIHEDQTREEFMKEYYQGYIDEFLMGVYFDYYEELSTHPGYSKDKKNIISTLLPKYQQEGSTFWIEEEGFQTKGNISFYDFLISFLYAGLINIRKLKFVGDIPTFEIQIQDELLQILNEVSDQMELIMDRLLDKKYREIKIKKKKGKAYLLEGEIEYSAENENFINIHSKHPFSDIRTSVHNGKTDTYLVNEKVRLDRDKK